MKWQQGVTAGIGLSVQAGSAVVGDCCPGWEYKFRLFSCDIVNILLKTNGGRGGGGEGGRDRKPNFEGRKQKQKA